MIRKSLFTFYLLYLCTLLSWGQNIRVESFNRLDNDITARTSVVLDANDDECALIKMVTTDTDYNVDGCIKRRDDRVGELWFYVPQGTKQIVIRHKRLGKLVYPLPEVLKSKVTYQITLPDNVEIIVHEDAGGQYLVMKVEPAESTVYIDGIAETLNGGVLQKFLSYGTHTYRVEAPLYQPMEGNIQIADARKDMTVSLLPDYGFVQFASVPENGATVYMNGQELGKTPFTTGRLMKGIYTVNATLPMHAPATQQIMIEPGKTSNITLNFSASYGTVNLTATDADIYVNNELKGAGKWNGRLSTGLHRIEARKAGHRPGVLSLDVVVGQTQTISLPAPTPMYASLDISCDQTDAHVYIDGKDMGLAPNVFKILAGKHTIELKNETFNSPKYEVELGEGEAKRIAGVLSDKIKKWGMNDIVLSKDKKNWKLINTFYIDQNNEVCYTKIYNDFYKYSFRTRIWKKIYTGYQDVKYLIKEWKWLVLNIDYNRTNHSRKNTYLDLMTGEVFTRKHDKYEWNWYINFVNEDLFLYKEYDYVASPVYVYYKDGISLKIEIGQGLKRESYFDKKVEFYIDGTDVYLKAYDKGVGKKAKKGIKNVEYFLCTKHGVKSLTENGIPAKVHFIPLKDNKAQDFAVKFGDGNPWEVDITPYTSYNPAIADFKDDKISIK